MAKDYNSYTFRNKAVDNIQSRTNTANDPEDKKKRQQRKENRATDREDRRKRKAEIKRQATKSRSGLKAQGTYDVDVSGERKVKKKVAKIDKKIAAITENKKKDARQKKLVKAGLRTETKKNKLLQKRVDVQRVTKGKLGEKGKRTKEKVPKDKTVKNKSNALAQKDRGGREKRKYKPIKRGVQINRTKSGGGGKRRSNNAIQKGKSIFGKNKKI